MSDAKSYVRADEHGVYRVGQTRVSLESVVYAFQAGHGPETIRQQYPALSLEEVYGAIAFYLANRQEVDRYLEQQRQRWEELRRQAEQAPSPVVERLRSARSGSLQEKK
jgi:uncharacterized protein (DUF433 family)